MIFIIASLLGLGTIFFQPSDIENEKAIQEYDEQVERAPAVQAIGEVE